MKVTTQFSLADSSEWATMQKRLEEELLTDGKYNNAGRALRILESMTALPTGAAVVFKDQLADSGPVQASTVRNVVGDINKACKVTELGIQLVAKWELFPDLMVPRQSKRIRKECKTLRTSLGNDSPLIRELAIDEWKCDWHILVRVAQVRKLSQSQREEGLPLAFVGITTLASHVQMLDFVAECKGCKEIFILQNALPESYELRKLWSRHHDTELIRIVLYHPENKFIVERENEINDQTQGAHWLSKRVIRSIEDLLDASENKTDRDQYLKIALTDNKIPFMMYGSTERIYLGWPFIGHQSNEMPQFVIEAKDKLYPVLKGYFEYFFSELSKPKKRVELRKLLNRHAEIQGRKYQKK